MDAIAPASIPRIASHHEQALANTAWAFATLLVTNCPLLNAIAAAAINRLSFEFRSQEIANLSWAFAVLAVSDDPLCDSIAAFVNAKLDAEPCAFSAKQLASTAWAFATLEYIDSPLLDALATAVRIIVRPLPRQVREDDARALVAMPWATSGGRNLSSSWKLLAHAETCGIARPEAFAPLVS